MFSQFRLQHGVNIGGFQHHSPDLTDAFPNTRRRT